MDDKQLRGAILRLSKDRDVRERSPMFASDYVSLLGLSNAEQRRVVRALEYLAGKRYLSVVRAGRNRQHIVVGITAEGIDEVERPKDDASRKPGDIHFNAAVGSVQFGDHNTAHVTQNIGGGLKELVDALVALREETAHDPSWSAIHAVTVQAVDEATTHASVTARLKGFLVGLGQLVQSTGAVMPAYNAIYALAPTLNIHGLPPPPGSP